MTLLHFSDQNQFNRMGEGKLKPTVPQAHTRNKREFVIFIHFNIIKAFAQHNEFSFAQNLFADNYSCRFA